MKDLSRNFFKAETVKLFGAVLLPIFLLGIVLGAMNVQVLRMEIERGFRAGTGYLMEELENMTTDIESLNESLTTNPALTLRLKTYMQHAANEGLQDSEFAGFNAIQDLIYASIRQDPYVDSAYIYYEDGASYFISSQGRLSNLEEYFDTQWHQSYLKADLFLRMWKEPRHQVDAEGICHDGLTIYQRIFAGGVSGSDRGLLVLNLNQARIERMLEDPDDQAYVGAFVVDDAGSILFRNSTAKEVPEEALEEILLLNHAGIWMSGYVPRLGRAYTCIGHDIENYGWHLIRNGMI